MKQVFGKKSPLSRAPVGVALPFRRATRAAFAGVLVSVACLAGCASGSGEEATLITELRTDDSEEPRQNIRKATPEEAAETDLRLVAEARGWRLEEAGQNRETADRLGELQAKLMEKHGNTFAGAYLSEEPTAPPTIRFVGGVPAKAREAIEASGLQPNIETDATFTLARLRADTMEAIDTLAAKGFKEATAAVDQRTGRVRVEVRDDQGRETAASVRRALPEAAQQTVSTIDIRPRALVRLHHTRGGEKMPDASDPKGGFCTSGWSVHSYWQGVDGVVTAGHCPGGLRNTAPAITALDFLQSSPSSLYSAPFQSEHVGERGDMQWHTTTHNEYPEFWPGATGGGQGTLRNVLSVKGAYSISQGEPVCRYGRASNYRDCNTSVKDVWFSATYDNGAYTAHNMVRMNGSSGSINQDSGGGWSYSNTAYGLHMGTVLNEIQTQYLAVWSRADFLYVLGVEVMTL